MNSTNMVAVTIYLCYIREVYKTMEPRCRVAFASSFTFCLTFSSCQNMICRLGSLHMKYSPGTPLFIFCACYGRLSYALAAASNVVSDFAADTDFQHVRHPGKADSTR